MSPGAAVLEVLEPGLLTTVQAAGRPAAAAWGVPPGGALDPDALAAALALAGAPSDAAALECTLVGPRLLALRDVVVAIAGGDLGGAVAPSGRPAAPWRSHRLVRGEVLDLTRGGTPEDARTYLAIPGGFDVPAVLGSRATSLPGGFGGLDGRPLRAGDVLLAADAEVSARRAPAGWPAPPEPRRPDEPVELRVLPGPAGLALADPVAVAAALAAIPWRVAPASDRRGLRLEPANPGLDGAVAALAAWSHGELPTHGVVAGTIQLPPGGGPLLLLADAGTTGGYPVAAVVAAADLPRAGRLAPGAAVMLRVVDGAAARAAEVERRTRLTEAIGALAGDATTPDAPSDPWDDLALHAGG